MVSDKEWICSYYTSRIYFGDPELDVSHVSYLVIQNWM
jgi:hypothetical protein